jgi:hypothetical protein
LHERASLLRQGQSACQREVERGVICVHDFQR